MQVEVKSSFYQSFGGINFMEADFRRLGLDKLIIQQLGFRNLTAVYSYADVLKSLFYMFSIGGDVLDDLNILREQLQDQPVLKACSPDTVEYVCQELRQPTRQIITDKGVSHQINEHDSFNSLLAALSLYGGTLNRHQSYTLDYDGHIVENTKPDNTCNYKQTQSYYPVILSIKKLPVFIQNRNGNTPESYDQLNLIRKTVIRCEALSLQLKKFRADACCYEKDTIEYLEQNGFTYYIRAEMNAGLRIALEDEPEWQPVILNNKKVEVCSLEEKLFGSQPYRRIVAYRYKVKGQLTIDDANGYRYYSVVTNDTADALSCIEFYNQRGCEGEHHFKELDHDFGWNKLPFDNMEMNTVYLYATTIAYLLFNIFKKEYAAKTTMVQMSMQLKNFILHFVTLPAKWIKTGRRYILKIFTKKDYSLLFAT
jgi:Transposase DDE domain group 1